MRERQECRGLGHKCLIFGEQGEQEEGEFGSEHKEFSLGHVGFEIPITDKQAVRCTELKFRRQVQSGERNLKATSIPKTYWSQDFVMTPIISLGFPGGANGKEPDCQ